MLSTYEVRVGKDVRFTFSANFADASSPIRVDGNSTPFQVADARHYPEVAAEKLILWSWSEGGPAVEVELDDDGDPIIVEEYEVVELED